MAVLSIFTHHPERLCGFEYTIAVNLAQCRPLLIRLAGSFLSSPSSFLLESFLDLQNHVHKAFPGEEAFEDEQKWAQLDSVINTGVLVVHKKDCVSEKF